MQLGSQVVCLLKLNAQVLDRLCHACKAGREAAGGEGREKLACGAGNNWCDGEEPIPLHALRWEGT